MQELFRWLVAELSDPQMLIAQLFGFIPLTFTFFIYIFNDRRKIITAKALSDCLWAVHYFMLGEPVGGAINTINVVRGLVFSQKEKMKKSKKAILAAFGAASILCTIVTWNGIKSVFPMAGSTLAVFAFWCDNAHNIRKLMLPAASLWLIYGVLTGSISTIICNGMSIISIITTEIRESFHSKTQTRVFHH